MKCGHSSSDFGLHSMGVFLAVYLLMLLFAGAVSAQQQDGPSPLLDTNARVDWWFLFKFNADAFPDSCQGPHPASPFSVRNA